MLNMIKTKKPTDKKENKYKKIIETISNMNSGETITPTKLFKGANINPNDTGRDLLDFYESLKEVGFTILRKNNKVTNILKTDENPDLKKEVRNLGKNIIDIKNSIDELKMLIKK